MSVTISGTDGISTPPIVVQGSTSGGITLSAPAVAGTNTQTLVAASGTLAPLISGTAVASTSGTSIEFTSIPSWVKRITVMFSGVSTNGTSLPQVQLGSTTFTTSGYAASTTNIAAASLATVVSTAGFAINSGSAANLLSGVMILNLLSGNTWACLGSFSNASTNVYVSSGSVNLSGTLDRVRITTVNGTDTFDAGSINIIYE